MSGILNSLLGAFTGGQSGSGLTLVLTQLLSGQGSAAGGGLQGLLTQLTKSGLGPQVQSWVGTGENHPVTPEQLSAALPADHVNDLAQQAGTTPQNLLAALAHALPHAVDHATPDGQVPPAGGPVPDIAALVGRLLGKA